ERIRRVIRKLEQRYEERAHARGHDIKEVGPHASTPDLGFKVFKLDSSNIKAWNPDSVALENALIDAVESIRPGRSELDVLYELLLKQGIDLAVPIEERQIEGRHVYIVGGGALVVCLSDDIDMSVADGIAALKAELEPE